MSESWFQNIPIKIAILSLLIASCLTQDPPLLGALVPSIKTNNYQLVPDGNKYQLRLTVPNGTKREEVAELLAPGTAEEELRIKGTISNYFTDTGALLVVIYEAGKNGYVVKYKYEAKPTEPTFTPQFISAGGLKSAAG